ncbi:MAG: alpha/beta hydrolase family protein [Nevskiales bacterium]
MDYDIRHFAEVVFSRMEGGSRTAHAADPMSAATSPFSRLAAIRRELTRDTGSIKMSHPAKGCRIFCRKIGGGMRQLLLLGVFVPFFALAAEIPIEDFARDGDIESMQISPDGQYVAEARMQEGHDYIALVRLSDHQVIGAMDLGADRRVGRYWWVGSDRIVLSFAEQHGSLSMPRLTGELVAINADAHIGNKQAYLFGYRGEVAGTLRAVHSDRRAATVLRPVPDDERAAIVQINDYADVQHPGLAEVDRLNVFTGTLDLISRAPIRGLSTFLVDFAGNPRFAVTLDEHDNFQTYTKVTQQEDWKPLAAGDQKGGEIVPLALSTDNHRAFLLSTEGGERLCLVQQELDSGKRGKLSCDDASSASGLIMSFDAKEPIAALYGGSPPWVRVLDSPHPDAAKLKSLQEAFPGQIVYPVSSTPDGSKAILLVYSDRNPGDYYLFDPKTLKADMLASRRSWIDPEQMSEQRPVEFTARDGQSIHGLLTVPRGLDPKDLPLVVRPHGGPFSIYDHWGWDADNQLLASRGYAVLQVNFRGSGGYSKAFVDAGRKHWDTVMIDDITDGTRWAAAQGIADAGRVCIYGASYGGYAALMSAVREPDLYRCAIGYSGVYDLNRWKTDSDVSATTRGRTFIGEFVGADSSHLSAASPIVYIDRLKAAVMIVHGEDDERVPVSQARLLRKALEGRDYPYEWLVKPHEGHGFYLEKNRIELDQKLLAFLARNIGSQARAQAAAPPAADQPVPAK